ncbi:unnamed protein product [Leptosia nina]|uniref:Uncharacterized protein n=1 Tax=Leptosia nina TaxID=320188 RepID=A0AAV1JWS3_9NEOP
MTEGGEYKRRLDPNECEPGICVPYNCDPYECETWIQKRLRREKAHKRRFDTDSLKRNMDATKSAASAVSTFLKNCICSLKLNTKRLQNSPHLKFEVKPQRRNKNQFAKLEPYECEPNTCIPGECDPYECEKRIRKRLLRENATTTTQAKTTSQSTFTRNLRAHKGDYVNKQTYERPSRVMVQKLDKPKHVYQPKVPSHYEGQKQSVRIGSTFSFDVEFFKDRTFGDPAYRKRKNGVHRVRQYDTESNMARRAKYRTKGQQFRDGFGRYDASQFAGIPTQSTSTITDPQLKRCFCTLQLHKSAASVNEMKRQPLQTQNKMTHTKNTLSYNVTSPYECPPFMCVPNECDPYECERKLRKLNIRSQAIGTEGGRRKRNRYIDASSVTTRTQKVQSNFVQKPKHYKEGNVVEVPRFTNYLKKQNWQGVKVGSNVSFNIEFYKEFSPPGQKRKPKKIKEVVYDEPHLVTGDRGKYATKYVSPPHLRNLRNTESQVEARGMENKSSNTINRLKRCFCTLKLQKNRSALPVPYPQSFEVRRAEVQNKMFPKVPFPQAFDVFLTKTQKNQIKPKEQNTVEEKAVVTKITRSKVKKTKFKNDNEMQTILSYKPKKFDKKASKTILMENKINKKENKKKHRGKFSKKNRLTRKQSKLAMNTDKSCYCEKFVGPLKKYHNRVKTN